MRTYFYFYPLSLSLSRRAAGYRCVDLIDRQSGGRRGARIVRGHSHPGRISRGRHRHCHCRGWTQAEASQTVNDVIAFRPLSLSLSLRYSLCKVMDLRREPVDDYIFR